MVLNALAAIGMALEMGIEVGIARAALEEFSGAERRFTIKGERGGVIVVDDYGHHPTEIAATLAGARAGFPDRRIVAAFQPHRYSRTHALLDEFARAFFEADVVAISDIYAASEAPIPGLTGQTLVDALRSVGQREVHYVPEIGDMPKALLGLTKPNDILITFGAGSITQVGPALLHYPHNH
jgi:UDP-N-acetylmuramate--alanine ligase